MRSVGEQRPQITQEQLEKLKEYLCDAVPDCLVTGYEPLIDSLKMNDADDRHVVAAAIRAGAQMIVTFNTRDFPADVLGQFNIEAQHPDDFVLNQIHLDPGAVVGTIQQQATALKAPPLTVDEVLASLERNGLIQTVTELRRLMPK